MTHFSARAELVKLGYTNHAARRLGRKLQQRMDAREIAALFAGDPTAIVAVLRAHGIPAPARYAAMAVVS